MITQIKNKIVQMQGDQKRKVLLIGVGGVILLLLDILFIFLPLINKAAGLKSQIISVRANITSLNRQISMLDATKKKLEDLRIERAKYEKKFPKEEEVPALLGNLSTIAGRLGVDIIAVKPVKTDSKQTEKTISLFHEVPVEIFAKGGYHQIGQFINKLETLDKFIKIQGLEIAADNATPSKHFFKLLVSMYILRI